MIIGTRRVEVEAFSPARRSPGHPRPRRGGVWSRSGLGAPSAGYSVRWVAKRAAALIALDLQEAHELGETREDREPGASHEPREQGSLAEATRGRELARLPHLTSDFFRATGGRQSARRR